MELVTKAHTAQKGIQDDRAAERQEDLIDNIPSKENLQAVQRQIDFEMWWLWNPIKNLGLRKLSKSILNAACTLMICCLIVACKAGRPGEWAMLEMEEAICVVSEWEQHAKGGATTSAPSTKSMAQPKTMKAKAQAKREVRRQKLSINTVFCRAQTESYYPCCSLNGKAQDIPIKRLSD